MSGNSNYLFRADFSKGNVFKGDFDVIHQDTLKTVHFRVNEDGLYIGETNDQDTNLYIYQFSYMNFKKFIFNGESSVCFSVLTKDIHKQLKGLKKKDFLSLYIIKNTNKLVIEISPDSSGGLIKIEKYTVNIDIIDDETLIKDDVPSEYYEKMPVRISSSEYQKIKKLTSACKVIRIRMQPPDYISFEAYDDSLLTAEQNYGEPDPEKEIYDEKFNVINFSPTAKLPSICSDILFFKPISKIIEDEEGNTIEPSLKIFINAAQNSSPINTITIYIKPSDLVAREIKEKDNDFSLVAQEPVKKTRRSKINNV